MKVFLKCPKLGAKASGEFNPATKELTVFAGSVVSTSIKYSEKFRGANLIAKFRERYVVDRVVKEHVYFKSPSTAANFLTGNSTNGLIVWKTEKGETLQTVLNSLK